MQVCDDTQLGSDVMTPAQAVLARSQLLVLDVPSGGAPGSQPPKAPAVLRISSAPLRPQPHSRPVLRTLRLLTPAAL